MRIYLATTPTSYGKLPGWRFAPWELPTRALVSYHYFRRTDLRPVRAALPVDLFADSGAYSAFTLGKAITVDEYAEWLNANAGVFTAAAALDDLADAAKSFAQTERLRALCPTAPIVPVVHSTDTDCWAWLARYVDAGYDYIGISPVGPICQHTTSVLRWCAQAHARLPAGVRTHAFGVTAWRVLTGAPWYSADSSSWRVGSRYGQILVFDPVRGLDYVHCSDRAALAPYAAFLRAVGSTPADLLGRDHQAQLRHGARVVRYAENWINARPAAKETVAC